MPKVHGFALGHYNIGLKLRTLRAGKLLTLSRLAAETGLSTALLSKLETDRMVPTLQTLSIICRVYGVSLSHFFSDPTRHSVSITRKGHLDAVHRPSEAVRRVPLHYDHIGSGQCGASLLEFPPNLRVAASDPGQGVSCLVYVIEGRLELNVGTENEVLEAGDCACIDTDMIVVWGSSSQQLCRVLVVRV